MTSPPTTRDRGRAPTAAAHAHSDDDVVVVGGVCCGRSLLGTKLWPRLVTVDACWEWTGRVNLRGYGRIQIGGDKGPQVGAHRVAWILTNGPIPDGLLVCHTCDNPRCCNPAHLFLGTHFENMGDATRKGRRRARTQLTAAQVREIVSSEESCAKLARRFNISSSFAWGVKNGHSLAWLAEEAAA